MTPNPNNVHLVEVTVLHGSGCARIEPLIDFINETASQLQIEISINAVLVDSRKRAKELCSLGSPTVLVDGIDVEPAARWRKDYTHG